MRDKLRESFDERNVLFYLLVVFAGGVSAVATSFGIYATSSEFLVTSMNSILLDLLPGSFISYVIQSFGNFALGVSMLASGVFLSLVIGVLVLAGYVASSRLVPEFRSPVGFIAGVVLVSAFGFAVVGNLVAVVAPAVAGAAVTVALLELARVDKSEEVSKTRRSFVRAVGAVGAYNVVAHLAGLFRRSRTQRSERQLQETAELRRAETLLGDAREQELDFDGITGLVSDIDEFYRVDINPSPPRVDSDGWTLSVTGEVADESEFDLTDLQSETTRHRFMTLRCLGDGIEDDQMDTALWTGCSVTDVLERAEPEGDHVMMHAVDDYFYSVPLDYLDDAMLVWGMNARELPQDHGYPVRVILPDRWGKLNVKWIEEIEVTHERGTGYWEERGWEGMGTVNTVTKVGRISRPEDGVIRVGGHAYAGKRGVQEVQVSIDGGGHWESATLSGELPHDDTWRQWMYEWEGTQESYDFLARAVDGDGNVQTVEERDPLPDGATGWVSRTVRGNV